MQSFPDRCQHLKINGTQCGSPALRRNRFCFFHKRFQDERIRLSADRARRGVATFVLPVLEDANSIQIALMQVMRLLVAQQIDHKTASLLLYALQTASTNLRLTQFAPSRHDVVVDPRTVGQTPLNSRIWDDADFDEEQDEEENEVDGYITALEKARKKKEDEAKWRRWGEAEAERLMHHDPTNETPCADPSAAVTATGSALVSTASSQKKPASALNMDEVRQRLREQIRKELLPACPPEGSSSSGQSSG
jgi:hypothetical protein